MASVGQASKNLVAQFASGGAQGLLLEGSIG